MNDGTILNPSTPPSAVLGALRFQVMEAQVMLESALSNGMFFDARMGQGTVPAQYYKLLHRSIGASRRLANFIRTPEFERAILGERSDDDSVDWQS